MSKPNEYSQDELVVLANQFAAEGRNKIATEIVDEIISRNPKIVMNRKKTKTLTTKKRR